MSTTLGKFLYASKYSSLAGGGKFGGSLFVDAGQLGANSNYCSAINGDLTIEFWVYYPSAAVRADWRGIFGSWPNNNTSSTGQFSFMIGATYTICSVSGGVEIFPPATTTRWADGLAQGYHHAAIVRSGTTWTVYIDGVAELVGTSAVEPSLSSTAYLLCDDSTYDAFDVWVDSLRVSSMARYTANFTPPAAPFNITTDPNANTVTTQLQLNTVDTFDATGRNPFLVNGGVTQSATAKFGTGSLQFDGTSGYLSSPINPDFDMTVGPWTIDFWAYPTAPMEGSFVGIDYNSGYISWAFRLSVNGLDGSGLGLVPSFAAYNGVWNQITDGTTQLTLNVWNHLEVGVDSSNVAHLFLNGVLLKSGTVSLPYWNSNLNMYIGRRWDLTQGAPYFSGMIDEVCITKGAIRNTTSFTPPTAPYSLTTDPYAADIVCLLHMDQMPALNNTAIADDVPTYAPYVIAPYFLKALVGQVTTPFIWKYPGTVVNSTDALPIVMTRGNSRYIQEANDDRTSLQIQMDTASSGGFVNGICVNQANPLQLVNMDLARNVDFQIYDRKTTNSTGTFTFHDLQIDQPSGYYLIGANPNPSVLVSNAQIFKGIDAMPYAITTTGLFSYTAGTLVVNSTVTIVGNDGPFTATLASGALPPGASISVSSRSISISGATALTGSYIFTLSVAGSVRGYSSLIPFELFTTGSNTMGATTGYQADALWVQNSSNLLISIEFNNIALPTDWSSSVNGLPSLTSSGTPTKSTIQFKVGDCSLSLNGSSFVYTSTPITYPTGPVTIEAWIYLTTLKTSNVICGDNGNNTFQLVITASGQYYFSNGTTTFYGTTVLAINQWYHVAFTRDHNNNATFWLNGVSDTTGVYTGVLDTATSGIYAIGSSGGYAQNDFDGYINAFHLYNSCIYSAPFTPSITPFAPNLIKPLNT